jgi:DNA-binding NarL/FixJ family response regulator
MASRARILIADDHALVAEGCKKLLEPEFEVVGIVADGLALKQAAADLRPDVVTVDVAMPKLNGLTASSQIKQVQPGIQVIFLSMNTAVEVVAEAFRRGASGYVLKQSAAEELLIAVRQVLRGGSYISSLITKETVDYLSRAGADYQSEKQISERQREVLQLLAEGKSMKEIADILKVHPGTVAFHKYRILKSLELATDAELIEYAIKHYILPS